MKALPIVLLLIGACYAAPYVEIPANQASNYPLIPPLRFPHAYAPMASLMHMPTNPSYAYTLPVMHIPLPSCLLSCIIPVAI